MFARLDPRRFGKCVVAWMGAACEVAELRHVAIDGKAVRSAPKGTFSGCLHLDSAWAAENRLILGQEAVTDGSHEIAAIPELLKALELSGALVTIDAAGCQKEIAKQIRDQGGDYLLAVKGNRPTLLAAVQAAVGRACDADFEGVDHDGHGQVEDGHGRHEERYVTAIYEPEGLPPGWPGVAAVSLQPTKMTVGTVDEKDMEIIGVGGPRDTPPAFHLRPSIAACRSRLRRCASFAGVGVAAAAATPTRDSMHL